MLPEPPETVPAPGRELAALGPHPRAEHASSLTVQHMATSRRASG
jgi:hypothetical protein